MPGTSDQLDVNYAVVEKSSGNLSAGIGYSQVQGIVINANLSQDNVFGSGKRVNLAFNNSDYLTSYQFGFFNPYFTTDGVSVGYNLSYTDRNATNINLSNYSLNVADAGLDFGIPLNEFDQLRFGIDWKYTNIRTTRRTSSCQIDGIKGKNRCKEDGFITNNHDPYLTLAPSIGWTHDTLNRALFPSNGGQQRLSALATIPGVSDLEYFKVSYKHQEYFPLSSDFTLRLLADLAYGDGYGNTGSLPFFENYYGGGTGSVRGFFNNTIGPRDTPFLCRNNKKSQKLSNCRTPLPFGGSTKIVGSAELFFPVPFLTDVKSVRLGAFFDAGSIGDNFDISMKYSAGISGEWLSPFGALSVSAAIPLNAKTFNSRAGTGDQQQIFQFNFGQNF